MSKAWWQNAVIYQIYPRSFQDSSGNGIGDLPGIRRRLHYVRELGADAVWICPFVRSPMHDYGYDVANYREVDPLFGDVSDIVTLLEDAHELGLRVLVDQVWNHTSSEHPWFAESRCSRDNPKADWYVWADPATDGGPPNNWRATFGGPAWTYDPTRGQYYLHNFLYQQPDINWYNAEARKALMEEGRFWLDLGVDGFRLDVVNFYAHDRELKDNPERPEDTPVPVGALPHDPFFDYIDEGNIDVGDNLELISDIRDLMDEYPGTVALGEVAFPEDAIKATADYTQGEKRLHLVYNAAMINDAPFDIDLMRKTIERSVNEVGDARNTWCFGTHDFPRLASRGYPEGARVSRALQQRREHTLAALMLTLPGSCILYQGTELGLTTARLHLDQMHDPYGIANYPNILGRDGCRTPMPWQGKAPHGGFTTARKPWLPVPDEHRKLAVDRQETDPQSLLNRYRALIHWRRDCDALHDPALQMCDVEAPLLAYERGTSGDSRVLCAFNLSLREQTMRIDASARLLDELCDTARVEDGTLTLPPYAHALLDMS